MNAGEYDIDGAGQSSESFSTSVGEEENDGQDDNESEDFVGEDMPLLLNSTGEVDAAITAAANTPVGVPMEETEKAKVTKRGAESFRYFCPSAENENTGKVVD